MSHTVSLELRVKEPELFVEVAKRKGYRVEKEAKVELFSGKERGLAVYLPGWQYPVVVTSNGQIKYDNFSGNWGDKRLLDELVADYVQELALQTVRHKLSISNVRVSQVKRMEDGGREIKLVW